MRAFLVVLAKLTRLNTDECNRRGFVIRASDSSVGFIVFIVFAVIAVNSTAAPWRAELVSSIGFTVFRDEATAASCNAVLVFVSPGSLFAF